MKDIARNLMEQPSASSYRFVIGAILLLLHVSMGLNFLAPSAFLPLIMDDYGLGRGTASLLIALVIMMLSIFLVPGGVIVTKLGAKRALLLGGVLIAAGVLAPVAPNFLVLLSLRAALGLGVGIAFPATSALVVHWFRPRELPLMNGLVLAGQGTGVAISLFFGVALADAFGWRYALFIYGGLALVATMVWLFLGKTPRAAIESVAAPTVREVLASLREKTTLLLSLAAVGPFAVFVAFTSWLPTYYHEVRGMPLEQASALGGMIPVMGIFVSLLGGYLAARLGRRKPLLVLSGTLFPFAAFGSFLFEDPVLVRGAVALLGFCAFIYLPTLLTIPMDMLNLPGMSAEKVAIMTGAALTLGNLSSFFSPIFIGTLTDALGSYEPSMAMLAFLPVTLLIAARFLPETGPKASRSWASPVPLGLEVSPEHPPEPQELRG